VIRTAELGPAQHELVSINTGSVHVSRALAEGAEEAW